MPATVLRNNGTSNVDSNHRQLNKEEKYGDSGSPMKIADITTASDAPYFRPVNEDDVPIVRGANELNGNKDESSDTQQMSLTNSYSSKITSNNKKTHLPNQNNRQNTLLPILALLTSQMIQSSWHVLGKHVMHQVPYLTPIAYVLARTGLTACLLLCAARICEGPVPFPPLKASQSNTVAWPTPKSSSSNCSSSVLTYGGDSGSSFQSSAPIREAPSNKKMDDSNVHAHVNHTRPRRKRRQGTLGNSLKFFSYLLSLVFSNRYHRRTHLGSRSWAVCLKKMLSGIPSLLTNSSASLDLLLYSDSMQIVSAGLSGMLLLPLTYTTGLVLTTPTVASVWDGPMIPLGCFLTAVGLGVEKRSRIWPNGQILSLVCAVGGSLVVLLGDYVGGGGNENGNNIHLGDGISNGSNDHWEGRSTHEFLQGNMVLMGVVASYSAMALLQKRLNHYPPITLTGWMFASGFFGCVCVVVAESILVLLRNFRHGNEEFNPGGGTNGSSIAGCTLQQAVSQLAMALTTSPTFRYGLLYACLLVGGVCFSITSYAASHLESSVITLFAACQPPMTSVLEWIWEGKEFGWKKLLGMGGVGLGMYCFTYIKRIERKCHSARHSRHKQYSKGVQPRRRKARSGEYFQHVDKISGGSKALHADV